MKQLGNIIIILVFSLAFQVNALSQNTGAQESFRIVFYNLENYFDASIDSSLKYNEFTQEGDMRWTNSKFHKKARSLSKVFQALSTWDGVALAGVCEIENQAALDNLLYNTPLKSMHYKYVHFDSHDKRGIDVALIYGEQFIPIYSSVFSIVNEHDERIDTRDILYVKGFLESDTIHVFVNHWTSRYRGLLESNALRMDFSELLKSKTDSILKLFPDANIIAMGDFNDQPKDASIKNLTTDGKLTGLPASSLMNNVSGTMKYKEEWYIFDQILVSESLLNGNGLRVNKEGLRIFDMPFVLEDDSKYLGNKPFRTNLGFKYHGGYSDHLPVFLDLNKK